MTANGKVDRRALPALCPQRVNLEDDIFMAPSTELEKAIASVWQEVLQVDQVSTLDKFFDLGGHSLSALKVIDRLGKESDIRIDVGDLMFQTLGQLAFSREQRVPIGTLSSDTTATDVRTVLSNANQDRLSPGQGSKVLLSIALLIGLLTLGIWCYRSFF